MDRPLRHISIRVPWHDAGWSGVVCKSPQLNGACTKLKRIAGHKRDAEEQANAGKRLDDLPDVQWPCCLEERGTFMAPFELLVTRRHALAASNQRMYGHFKPTKQRMPAYAAGVVPFRWLMREQLPVFREQFELDVDPEREPDLGYESTWVHEAQNQRSVLDGFADHLRTGESLTLFYAKHVPFVEGTGRILVGAGRIADIGKLAEYERPGEGMPGMIWERPVQHSIRPKGKDGFLLPYAAILSLADKDPSLDIERYVARAPDEHWDEFSYASELVTHDGAIGALLAIDTVLQRMQRELGLDTEAQRQWLANELTRLWKVRGPYPGLGAVLQAFGLSRGIFVAQALQEKAGANADPWPLVAAIFKDPATLPKELRGDIKELATTWKGLSDRRRTWLRLLSRFELTIDQAKNCYDESTRTKCKWVATDQDLIKDPYLLYGVSRHDSKGIRLMTVDRGVFPDETVMVKHPLAAPSQLESALDVRRVRAFAIQALEAAAVHGHTLLGQGDLAQAIQEAAVRPACPVTTDILAANAAAMAPSIVVPETTGDSVLQLSRYQAIRDLVHRELLRRVKGTRHPVGRDWEALLQQKFGRTDDDEERRARQEKAKALAELAESRFAVLAGPAGAGKTTVLGILCVQEEISKDGLLLLAPTGKARVRMQELAGSAGAQAQTIAQFLNRNSRYDGSTGRYFLSDAPKVSGFGTVIIDEASMLTEDMLGALLDALQGVKRLILVGDPAQLPPIGAGRPFVDIIARLRPKDHDRVFPRVGPGYAELTIERRQVGTERPDLRLARWFSANPPAVGEDDIFDAADQAHSTIRFVPWDKPEDFQPKLLAVLAQELKLSGVDDIRGFNRQLGAVAKDQYDYFNRSREGEVGSVAKIDGWQILSPLRGNPFGIGDINRCIHEHFRSGFLELASRQRRPIPKPFGSERVVYGDKVINLSNHRRDGRRVYPAEGAIGYLANGEIGIAVGQFNVGQNPKILKVEFSSQKGYTYDFYGSDFREEGDAALELAYALTVHKAQGSQFGLVILVLPQGHPIMSRELIYTALTRHQDRVVIMHQGSRSLLKDFAAPHRSEIARRRTNLLSDCRMIEIPQSKGRLFLQDGLIHRTSDGRAVRSKSELLIAEALINAKVDFVYEKALTLGGKTRYPDFTIEDSATGRIIYWEHLGMLDREEYRRGWEAKHRWYLGNGISVDIAHGGPVLVTTDDAPGVGLDMAKVKSIIHNITT